MRMHAVRCVGFLACTATAGLAAGGTAPVAVSPGGMHEFTTAADPCPTFSWGGGEASGYELLVYRFDGRAPGTSGAPAAVEQLPELRVALPGAASSWTPPADECLVPGQSYFWLIGSLSADGSEQWSDPMLLRIAATPSLTEVERAVAVLDSYLRATRGAAAGAPAAAGIGAADGPAAPASRAAASGAGPSGAAAIRAELADTVGEVYGVAGISHSVAGAGVAAAGAATGADLLLDGGNDLQTSALLDQAGLDRPSAAAESFDIHNSGAGTMTLKVDGTEVVTTLTDADTTYQPGNQLALDGTRFDVEEGPGSGLDADTVDGSHAAAFLSVGADSWVDESGDTMSGTLTLDPAAGEALIVSAGNVGIGTPAPQTRLHVGGYSMADLGLASVGLVYPDRLGTLVVGGNTPFDGDNGQDSFVSLELRGSNPFATTTGPLLTLTRTDAAGAGWISATAGSSLGAGGSVAAGSILFAAGDTGATGLPGGSVTLTAGDHSNGGAGGEVVVAGGRGGGGDGAVRLETGGATRLTVGGDGNVGIGAPSSGARLDVSGSVRIADGTHGPGRVLTSDAAGLTSWTQAGVPSGAIVMWSGTLASIPAGWQLCDGTNGSPDLRNRFVYGVGSGEDPGATGGTDGHSLTLSGAQLPAHSHSFSTDAAGVHRHDLRGNQSASSNTHPSMLANDGGNFEERMTEAGNHVHSGSTAAAGASSPVEFDNRPAYFRLAYIMKI